MPRKNPLEKLKDVADATVSTVVETAKDPVAAGQRAVGQAVATVGAVAAKVPGRRGRPVPASLPDPARVAVPQAGPLKTAGDPVAPAATKAPAKKAAKKAGKKPAGKTATKVAAKKAPVKKVAAKKASAEKVPAKKAAPVKSAAKKASAKKTVTKAPVKKSTAKKSTAKKSTAKKSTAKKSPAKKSPATSRTDTEPLLDPGMAKAVRSESETVNRAADPHPGSGQ